MRAVNLFQKRRATDVSHTGLACQRSPPIITSETLPDRVPGRTGLRLRKSHWTASYDQEPCQGQSDMFEPDTVIEEIDSDGDDIIKKKEGMM